MDLRSAGFKNVGGHSKRWADQSVIESIYFTSDNEIVAIFSTGEEIANARENTNQDRNQPSKLRAVFVDAATGNIRIRKELIVPSKQRSIFPTAAGELVLVTPERLDLFSSDLRPLNELLLPPPSIGNGTGPRVLHSRSGKSVLLVYYGEHTNTKSANANGLAYDFVWIDTEKMAVLRKWTEWSGENIWNGTELINASGGHVSGISDSSLMLGFHGATLVRSFDQPSWRLLCYRHTYCDDPQYLNDETLLTYFRLPPALHGNNAVALLGADGKLIFKQQLGYNENDRLAPPQVSADGRRMAFLRYRVEGEVDFADFHVRDPHRTLKSLMLFDVVARHWVWGLEFNKKRNRISYSSPDPAIALSPSGTYMGFLCGGIVEAYRLP
jgi:hypothetical protein